MAFVNRIKKGLNVTKFKADQMLRINNLQSEITAIQQQMNVLQMEVAKMAYAAHKQGHLENPELDPLFEKYDSLMENIKEREQMIAAIRSEEIPVQPDNEPGFPKNPCPHCGYDLPDGAVFCPNCGLEVPEILVSQPSDPQIESIICPQCQTQLSAGAIFCSNCGYRIQIPEEFSEQEDEK